MSLERGGRTELPQNFCVSYRNGRVFYRPEMNLQNRVLYKMDKNSGVRPIGVGEVLCRIEGKCIGWVLKEDIQNTAGPLQTATGLQSREEAAIHSTQCMFEDERTDAVILVDARNAFSSLNR